MMVSRGSNRRGSSLIEIMAVMGLLAMISTTAYRMISSYTQVSKQHQQARTQRLAVQRLAQTVRADTLGSDAISVDDQTLSIVKESGDVRYTYNADRNRIERTAKLDQSQTSDQFPVGSDDTIVMSAEDDRVTITWLRGDSLDSTEDNAVSWCVEATR